MAFIDSQLLLNLAVTQLVQLTGLIALVALVNRLLAERAPRAALALWLLVFAKALTPPVWSAGFGFFSWVQAPAVATAPGGGSMLAVDWTASVVSPRLATTLLVAWAVGAVSCLILAAVKKRSLASLLRRDETENDDPLTERVQRLATEHELRQPDAIVVSKDELGPAVAGFSKTFLILPRSLVEKGTPEQLDPVILHELVHADRRDTRLAAALCVVRSVWWFHPLVWWATRQADRLVERCVDVTIVRDLGSGLLDYARGMVRVLELRATLQVRDDLASLRPCQITIDRLAFLRRVSRDAEPTRGRLRAASWGRRAGWALLAATLLPALPVDSLQPKCTGPADPCDIAAESATPNEPRSNPS